MNVGSSASSRNSTASQRSGCLALIRNLAVPVCDDFLLAGLNMFAFHPLVAHDISEWQTPDTTPALAKTAGAVSMLLWISVVICGRWIGFV